MPEPQLDLLCAEVADLTRQPEMSEIHRRVARRRLRRRAVAGTALALVVLTAGGLAAARLPDRNPAGPDGHVPSPSVWTSPKPPAGLPPEPEGPIRTAGTADGIHLYAMLLDCGDCPRLVGSDDAGRTWTTRYHDVNSDLFDFEVHAAGTLSTTPDSKTLSLTISTDGGRTWHSTTFNRTPVRTVPAGGWLSCYPSDGSPPPSPDPRGPGCVVGAVDPATRTVHPLASPPPVPYFAQARVPSAAGLWLAGTDKQGTPIVAVSRDGGATWSVHALAVKSPLPQLVTYDGRTAYLVAGDHGFRTADGGRTWQPTNRGAALPDSLTAESPSIVLPDGTQVLQRYVGNDFVEPMVGRDGGAWYEAERLPGGFGPPLSMTLGGGYIGRTWATIYLSSDGWHWTQVTPY